MVTPAYLLPDMAELPLPRLKFRICPATFAVKSGDQKTCQDSFDVLRGRAAATLLHAGPPVGRFRAASRR